MPDAFDPYYKWLAIPPDEQPANHYRLLGLKAFESDPEVIETAADRQMGHVRSFQVGKHATESQKLLNELSAARLCLLSTDKKAVYDQALRARLAQQQPVAPPAASAPSASAPLIGAKPVPAQAKPVRVAQAQPLLPVQSSAPSAGSLDFDPLDQSSSPRHKRRKSAAPQPALLMGAGAAVLAVVGLIWALVGGGEPPKQLSAKSPRAADTPSSDVFQDDAKPPRADGKPKPNPKAQATSKESQAEENSNDDAQDSPQNGSADVGPADAEDSVMPAVDEDDAPDSASPEPQESEAAPSRTAVPSAEALKTAIADIQSLLKAEFSAAKKSDQKIALAEKLLSLAKESDAPVERYALLSEAQRLVTSAGAFGLTMQAIDAIAEEFDVERLALAAEMVDAAADKEMPAAARKELVDIILPLVDEAVAAGQSKLARRLATAGLAAARKTNATDAAKTLARQAHDLAAQEKIAESADTARKVLETKPDDAEAHLTLGKYLCLIIGDWDSGLPHLKQGSDASLRTIAERELDGAESATDRMKLGDLWWDLADEHKGADKDRHRARAGYWYEQAAGELTGLSKTKVEKRLADLPASTTSGTPKPTASEQQRHRVAEGKWVELLPLVDPAKQTLRGKWTLRPDGLLGETSTAPIQIPVTIAGSYELEVGFTRLTGADAVGFIIPTSETQTMLGISGSGGTVSGLFDIDGRPAEVNESAIRPGSIENGKRHLLKIRVLPRGDDVTIDSTLNGRPCVRWEGLAQRLTTIKEWAPPQIHQPALGVWNPTVFHSVRFKLLSGTATIDGIAGPEKPVATSVPGSSAPRERLMDGLPKGAVLIATFDEPTILRKNGEVRVRDMSGKQKPGLLVGAGFVPGKAGRALSFQKMGDHVDFGDDPSLNPPTLTVCAWIKPSPHDNQWTDIFSKHNDALGHSGFVLRLIWNMPEITLGLGDGSWHPFRQSSAVPLDEWTHLAVTYDDKLHTMYANGKATVTEPSVRPIAASTARCFVGSTPGLDADQFYGLIDEVAVFDRALSADAILQIYQLGTKGKSLAPSGKK